MMGKGSLAKIPPKIFCKFVFASLLELEKPQRRGVHAQPRTAEWVVDTSMCLELPSEVS